MSELEGVNAATSGISARRQPSYSPQSLPFLKRGPQDDAPQAHEPPNPSFVFALYLTLNLVPRQAPYRRDGSRGNTRLPVSLGYEKECSCFDPEHGTFGFASSLWAGASHRTAHLVMKPYWLLILVDSDVGPPHDLPCRPLRSTIFSASIGDMMVALKPCEKINCALEDNGEEHSRSPGGSKQQDSCQDRLSYTDVSAKVRNFGRWCVGEQIRRSRLPRTLGPGFSARVSFVVRTAE